MPRSQSVGYPSYGTPMSFLVSRWADQLSPQQQGCLGHSFHGQGGLVFVHSIMSRPWRVPPTEDRLRAMRIASKAAEAASKAASELLSCTRYLLLSGAMFSLSTAGKAYRDVVSVANSVPSTYRMVAWSIRAGLRYKRLTARHADRESADFAKELQQLHTELAHSLVQVCRRNGGVYVKAGQFAGAFGAIPKEYRCHQDGGERAAMMGYQGRSVVFPVVSHTFDTRLHAGSASLSLARVVLAQLEDRARPRPYSEIRHVLQCELGTDRVDKVFSEFDEQATAAASLAQVGSKTNHPGLDGAPCLSPAGHCAAVKAINGPFLAVPPYPARAVFRSGRQGRDVPTGGRCWMLNGFTPPLACLLRFTGPVYPPERRWRSSFSTPV